MAKKTADAELPVQKYDFTPKDDVSPLFSRVEFPTDRWGLTKDLRVAFQQVGTRAMGREDKIALVLETLRVGLGYLQAKFDADMAIHVAKHGRTEEPAAPADEAE